MLVRPSNLTQTKEGAILLVGLRAGKVLRFCIRSLDQNGQLMLVAQPRTDQDTFSYVSAGAVYHVLFVNECEFIALYTNGDVCATRES